MTPQMNSLVGKSTDGDLRVCREAVLRLVVLVLLFVWAFHGELATIAHATYRGDGILAAGAPLAIVCLLVLRRSILRDLPAAGSPLGVFLALAGVLWYAVFTWPYDYAFLRLVALPVVLAGCVLAAAGKRVLKHVVPILLILLLCMPLGSRAYAALIVKPETLTLKLASATLSLLPGVQVSLSGPDLIYQYEEVTGAIALGESNRGMMMLNTYAIIGVFVIFSRVRPSWQVVVAAIAGVPIVFAANFVRILLWGLVTIYGACDPASGTPRNIAGSISLLSAYVMFGIWCVILARLVVEERPDAPGGGGDDA